MELLGRLIVSWFTVTILFLFSLYFFHLILYFFLNCVSVYEIIAQSFFSPQEAEFRLTLQQQAAYKEFLFRVSFLTYIIISIKKPDL